MIPATILLLNLIATWYMVGLIWMVQVVHYKLFDRVGDQQFSQYERDHNRLITPVVGVAMLVELGTAVWLVVLRPESLPAWAAWTGLALIAVIWISTALLQVPCHRRLLNGFDHAAYQRLVATNWIRTILWTCRGVMLACFIVNQ